MIKKCFYCGTEIWFREGMVLKCPNCGAQKFVEKESEYNHLPIPDIYGGTASVTFLDYRKAVTW